MRSSWVTGWALNPVNVFERDGRGEGHAKTEEGTKELGGHKPRTTHSPQEPATQGRILPQGPPRGWPSRTGRERSSAV